MNTNDMRFKFLIFLLPVLGLVSCDQQDINPEVKEIQLPAKKQQASELKDVKFIVSFKSPALIESGYVVCGNGVVASYRFDEILSEYFQSESENELISYFNDAEVIYSTIESSDVANADAIANDLMNFYSISIEKGNFPSPQAKGLGKCEVYHIQKSTEEFELFPLLIMDGAYTNNQKVNHSRAISLLEALDEVLQTQGGMDWRFWNHYGFESE
jgi:hypothetical protein